MEVVVTAMEAAATVSVVALESGTGGGGSGDANRGSHKQCDYHELDLLMVRGRRYG